MTKYSQQMVKGMLQLLSNCPAETAHLRKELLIAAKHILTTELRNRTAAFLAFAQGLGRIFPLDLPFPPRRLCPSPSLLTCSSPLSLSPTGFCLPPGFSLYLLGGFPINVINSSAQFSLSPSWSSSAF